MTFDDFRDFVAKLDRTTIVIINHICFLTTVVVFSYQLILFLLHVSIVYNRP